MPKKRGGGAEGWVEGGISHVLRSVGEGGAVLGGRVLWTVRGHVAQHHHHRPVGIHPLGHAEVVDAVVGDDVRQVVLHGRHMDNARVLTCGEFMVNTRIKILQLIFFYCVFFNDLFGQLHASVFYQTLQESHFLASRLLDLAEKLWQNSESEILYVDQAYQSACCLKRAVTAVPGERWRLLYCRRAKGKAPILAGS